MKPRLTNEGIAAQVRAMGGDGITFSKFKIGNGAAPQDYRTATDLSNVIAEVELTNFTEEEDTGYVQLTGLFNNSEIEAPFLWREVGIYIQDPNDESSDLLYAYGHVDLDETGTAPEIPAAETEVYELQLTYRVFVGEAEDISAIIADSAVYATKAQLDDHKNDQTNPHAVTAEQVGLGNVPNVSTDDQEPTISQSATLTNLATGDKMSVIIGKIKKAIADLISHIGNSMAHVSPIDRTNWNNKANGTHNHAATAITSGVLGLARGGTGAATALDAANNVLASGANKIRGDIKIISKIRGYHLTDSSDTVYPAIYDNGSNLWFGAVSHDNRHHVGGTYISTGYNATNHSGNQSVGICVPNSDNTSSTIYQALHTGNQSSDIRLKENIKDTEVKSAMELINSVKVRSFDWKDKDEHQAIGFIADELEELDPKLAQGGGYYEPGVMNIKWIDTLYLLGYIVKGMQELSEENQELKDRLADIEEGNHGA